MLVNTILDILGILVAIPLFVGGVIGVYNAKNGKETGVSVFILGVAYAMLRYCCHI